MTLLWRFPPEQLVPHSLEVSRSVQMSGRHCSGDSLQSNWSTTPWRCLGVSRCLDDIALEIPSRATGPPLLGGVWECPDVRTTLLWRFPPGQLVPHSLEVSGSVQVSRLHCSGDSLQGNWSPTPWRCLGGSRLQQDMALTPTLKKHVRPDLASPMRSQKISSTRRLHRPTATPQL